MNNTQRTPAVARAIAALNTVAQLDETGWADISQHLGLAKSSTTNLVETMITGRLLRRHGGRLFLGGLVPELASGFVGHAHVLRRFALGWDKFPELAGYTLTIQSMLGCEFMYLDVRLGSSLLAYTPRAGSRFSSWHEGRPEPAILPVPPADIIGILDRFEGFHDQPEVAREITRWASDQHDMANGVTVHLRPSRHGHDEMTTLVTGATERGFPVTLSLHLPRTCETDVDEVSLSLRQFAATLIA